MRVHMELVAAENVLACSNRSLRKSRLKRVTMGLVAAAAVFLLGLTSYLIAVPSKEKKLDSGALRIKGVGDDLLVVVQRGKKQFVVSPLDRLQEGDRLAMAYSADRKGYLVIVSRDSEGDATVLYPTAGRASAPIFAGERIPLKEGGFVENGTGCEWVIAVFSDDPLDTNRVLRAVKESDSTSKRCGIDVTISRARSVAIIPMLR